MGKTIGDTNYIKHMDIEVKLQELREKYKTASIPMREIIKRQARALKLALEKRTTLI
jgi:hypothetical protein